MVPRWHVASFILPLVLIVPLVGCGPSLGTGGVAAVSPPYARSSPDAADGFGQLLSLSHDLGVISPRTPVSFLLLLRDTTVHEEAAWIAAMYDPRSPEFGHFASPRALTRLGPSPAAVRRVAAFLRAHGLRSSWNRGDDWLSVTGSAGAVGRTFDSHVHLYRRVHAGTFLAAPRDPTVPRSLHRYILGASHISTAGWQGVRAPGSGGLTPAGIVSAYHITPLRDAGFTGAGETVVFFEIDGFAQSDLDAYTRTFHLPSMHPSLKAGPRLQPGGEAEMDLEAVHAIAPGARLLVYNLDQAAAQQQANSDAQFENILTAFQRKIVTENPDAIVSNSVGGCANVLGKGVADALRSVYDRADALGEAWFAASGDQGAFDCLQNLEQPGDPPSQRDVGVDIPASEPGVTGVGGTRLSVNGDGTWRAESAWEGPVETAGGGGGVSTYFTRPSWQNAPGVRNAQLNSHGMRSVPDVSGVADPEGSGVYVIQGSSTQEGGTSQAAPIWAGIMALIDQYLRKHGGTRLGFANPALYALARSSPAYPPFHDVTVGSNLLYPAGKGYDMATGLGTPDAWNLARDLLAYERSGKP